MRTLLSVLLISTTIGCNDQETPKFKPDASTVYFVVGEKNIARGDSFIIGLTDPNEIASARNIIESGEAKIVFAEISQVMDRSKEGNFDLQNKRRWSWYVNDVLEFTDIVAEIYDGWPTYVEDNYDEWVKNTKGANGKGRIGFWNYTVKREISAEELQGL